MNWEAMKSYLPLYEKACILTLKIGWIGILFAIVIGLFCALIRHYKVPVLSTIAGGYIELFRNTPLLVQLFFLYFGLPKLGISIGAEFCGVLGLALLGGAYMAEAFRSGLESVEQIQMESAGNEQTAGGEAYYSPAGDFNQCTGVCRKYHIFAEGDECVFCNQFDGFDVYSKRLDRLVL